MTLTVILDNERKNKCVSATTERVMASDLLPQDSPTGIPRGGPITVTVK